jgi:hydrogenase maturation protein HypF
MDAKQIHVNGVVQGVGYRPFVYRLAQRYSLSGWVRNTSAGVDIIVEGETGALHNFIDDLNRCAPPLAHIDDIKVRTATANGFTRFEIQESAAVPGGFQPVSPDVALCAQCERELFDPTDRRYLYPFINCTHCGPRFTIIRALPYDRPATSMATFALCADCQVEYTDPSDRRFHAQPVACPQCGPQVWLETKGEQVSERLAALLGARRLLREGSIIAIKGLGGFHLACDATNAKAVAELRRRKGRAGKPFALMAADINVIETLCKVNEAERALLMGREKPIVILKRHTTNHKRSAAIRVADEVAPNVDTLGLMLPYTPLHHLLLNQTDPTLAAEPAPRLLVMTSGNLSEEPIITDNEAAQLKLASIADAFLLHNREIDQHCDDSVMRIVCKKPLHLRRARGYAPYPVTLPFNAHQLLAVGGELKNTFCLTRERYAFLSQHIGDMENVETLAAFERSQTHLQSLFGVRPEAIVHDLHPGYLTTRWARRQNLPLIGVQHHHAHIAACTAENGLTGERPVIGLAFDGTGYGTDGTIWGGEVLIADYKSFQRFAHLEPLPLPGGDAAIRQPWRAAVGYATGLGLSVSAMSLLKDIDLQAMFVVEAQIQKGINAPLTSSMGRLFDVVAALAGGHTSVSYEAQAAIEMEEASHQFISEVSPYYIYWDEVNGVQVIRVHYCISEIITDVQLGRSLGYIGARFHLTLVEMAAALCREARQQLGLNQVALSGGVWQNTLLLSLTIEALREQGFEVFTHHLTPANDGGLALGQAVIAARRMESPCV